MGAGAVTVSEEDERLLTAARDVIERAAYRMSARYGRDGLYLAIGALETAWSTKERYVMIRIVNGEGALVTGGGFVCCAEGRIWYEDAEERRVVP